MKLMGFKPKSRIKPYHNYRSSYFLYPDEDVREDIDLINILINLISIFKFKF